MAVRLYFLESSPKKIVAAIAIAIFVAAAFFFLAGKNLPAAPEKNFSGLNDESTSANEGRQEVQETVFSGPLGQARRGYGIPASAFEELPGVPLDFGEKLSVARNAAFNDYRVFGEEYFLQPEFYPSFPQNAVSYWLDANRPFYAAVGYGFFPAEQKIVLNRGKAKTARVFVHSGYGVETWQGARIIATAEQQGNVTAEILAGDFLLGPNYPVFSREWAKGVDMKTSAGQSAVPGKYFFKLAVVSPSQEKSEEWGSKHSGEYFNAAAAGTPFVHTIEVEVK